MTDCCTRLNQEIIWLNERIRDYLAQLPDAPEYPLAYSLEAFLQFLEDFVTLPPAFLDQPVGGGPVPTLAAMLQEVRVPLADGFSTWEWYNVDQPGKSVLELPDAPSDKVRVGLNGARLATPLDYTIAGTTLTFVYPLDIGDHVIVKSYGG